MSDYTPREFQLPRPNPVTAKRHRRQFRRQILLPILLSVVGLGGLSILLWRAGIGTVERWAQISTIFVLLPMLGVVLLLLVIMVLLSVMINELLTRIPPYTRLAQQAIETVQRQVELGMDISARPIVVIREYIAMVERLIGMFTGKRD
jgi:predicted PurR-regulated permease PerM